MSLRLSHVVACVRMSFFVALKRREVKSKGEKERYKYLNTEFQRVARRDKKAFLSDQCKEIEENNGMGKTRDLFKKIRDTEGTFHAKMGSIEGRNGMDQTEAEDIKKRWQEYTVHGVAESDMTEQLSVTCSLLGDGFDHCLLYSVKPLSIVL